MNADDPQLDENTYVHPINAAAQEGEWRGILDARPPHQPTPIAPTSRTFTLVQNARDITEADLWPEGHPQRRFDLRENGGANAVKAAVRKQRRIVIPIKNDGAANATVTAVGHLIKTKAMGTPIVTRKEWYHSLVMRNGSADTVGAVLLAEIVHLYSPDKHGVKRFYGDALQKSNKELAEQFNFSDHQVKDAMDRIEAAGFIRRELAAGQLGGRVRGNCQFIHLHHERLAIDKLAAEGELQGGESASGDEPKFDNICSSSPPSANPGSSSGVDPVHEHTGTRAPKKKKKKNETASPGSSFEDDPHLHPDSTSNKTEVPVAAGPHLDIDPDPEDETAYVALLLAEPLRSTFTPDQLKKLRELQENGRFSPEWADAAFQVLHHVRMKPGDWSKFGYFIPMGPEHLLKSPNLVETSLVGIAKDMLHNIASSPSRYGLAERDSWSAYLAALDPRGDTPEHDFVRAKGQYPARIIKKAGLWNANEMQERNDRLARR